MAKRFSETGIWGEDWFLDMPNEYKLFWFYMLSTCDHAGFYRVNLKTFSAINDVRINASKALEFFNHGKNRVRIIKDGFWFIEDFINFQYGSKLNRNNNTHNSILNLLNKFNINVLTIRGVSEVSAGAIERSSRGNGQV